MKEMLLSLYNYFFSDKKDSSISFKLLPLIFSNEAEDKILEQLNSRPAGTRSCFKIEIKYFRDKFECSVGFDELILENRISDNYKFPLMISERDENFLKGFTIDYHKEEKGFFIYPDVEIIVQNTPKPSILRFQLNRKIITNGEYGVSKLEWKIEPDKYPILITKLFISDFTNSIYAKENIIQIEMIDSIKAEEFEEEMVDILLSYFESCGYPLDFSFS